MIIGAFIKQLLAAATIWESHLLIDVQHGSEHKVPVRDAGVGNDQACLLYTSDAADE